MEKETTYTPLKRLTQLLSVDKREVGHIYIYAMFNGLINLSLPLGIQAIINFISGGMVSTSWIVLVSLVITGIALTGLLQIVQLRVIERLQQRIFTRAAFEFTYRLPRLKTESVLGMHLTELMNRFFDTFSVQKGLSKLLVDFSVAALQMVFGLILLSFYHPFFVIFGFILLIILLLMFRFLGPRGMESSLEESKYKYAVAHWLEEMARTIGVIKLAGYTEMPLKKTNKLVNGYLGARNTHFSVLVSQYYFMVAFKVLVASSFLALGGMLVIEQRMNIGQFVASEIIVLLVLGSVEKLITSFETIYDILTSLEKMGYVTDLPLESEEGKEKLKDSEEGFAVDFRQVSFTYPQKKDYQIHNLNLSIQAGEKVCLTGPAGSGKSLVTNLMTGMFESYQGSISFDKVPMTNINLIDLRTRIGDTLPSEELILATLEDNITLGREGITLEDRQKAADIVSLSDWIADQQDGWKTIINPDEEQYSVYLRNKIILARSIVHKPRLLLLEEQNCLLEQKAQNKFFDYIFSSDFKATVVMVSKSPEVLARANQVVLINHGVWIQSGPWEEVSKHPYFLS
ncbi:ATP-binding cassette domain-containing protein [Cytophagales bacterium LB-30]|uniref:ATP-binding cassette domain-containing protein n=1 Tax=Shiella aurantiaca TaxID=3058365 RepID=A0ABT8F8B8_9BACT|nr:ATP-binding cassette domain-containing protein [Shiella aurantiaca]MDN4166738.1 ATP-binding cassette domain-containing protein [Shiella aurantiaca]